MKIQDPSFSTLAGALRDRASVDVQNDAFRNLTNLTLTQVKLPQPFTGEAGGDFTQSGMRFINSQFSVGGTATLAILRPGLWEIDLSMTFTGFGADSFLAFKKINAAYVKNNTTTLWSAELITMCASSAGAGFCNKRFSMVIEKDHRLDFLLSTTSNAAATHFALASIVASRIL